MRSVGLRSDESFSDAVLLGPEYMVFSVTPRGVVRGFMKLDVRVRYANETLLEVKGVELDNFETVLLRGGKGMFGVKYFCRRWRQSGKRAGRAHIAGVGYP